ncbi:hypothetical protein CEXT_178311 [Caerostris extrusa]|uniref:Uncharacterized protein n=1 Tax=Caerostris extrusa TaxID=172846 RepID=A0AAV4QIS1_CAEEX|nr:hypothetical protein CEXT_178311 [Caerostris extrusa]
MMPQSESRAVTLLTGVKQFGQTEQTLQQWEFVLTTRRTSPYHRLEMTQPYTSLPLQNPPTQWVLDDHYGPLQTPQLVSRLPCLACISRNLKNLLANFRPP